MASIHLAKCKCGFNKKITVGGVMSGFYEHSRFPFYCQHCGLVEANIAQLIGKSTTGPSSDKQCEDRKMPTCPNCGNQHIDQYGRPPASVPTNNQDKTLQAWGFHANREGNLCPACKEMTLVFHSASILLD